MTEPAPRETLEEKPPKLTAAPDPLPPQWARAIANSIAANLAIDGWQTMEQTRDTRPNPPGHHYGVGSIPGPAPVSEFIGLDVYTWGSIDPRDYRERGIILPALVWVLYQLDLADEITKAQDHAVAVAGQAWLHRARTASVLPSLYVTKANRHGNNPRFIPSGSALAEELAAFHLAVKAARVQVVEDEHDYYDRIDGNAFDPLKVALFGNRVVFGDGGV